jgi:hypothetical protein
MISIWIVIIKEKKNESVKIEKEKSRKERINNY